MEEDVVELAPNLPRKVIHIDMDAFFASVETACNPSLKGMPIIVCGNPEGRTAVASASYEARRFGVKAGMGLREARKHCPNALIVEGSPKKYITTSLRILRLISKYSDLLELYSVDEAFLDVTKTERLFGGAKSIALEMKDNVKKKFGITCSVGIAPNKLLAKLASGFSKPDGLSEINPENVSLVLEDIPVEELCGIGEKTKDVLSKIGIRTCGELGRYDVRKLERIFGKGGRIFHEMGLGIDNTPVRPYFFDSDTKSFGHSMTFHEDTNDMRLLLRHLLQLSEQVGRRLRKEGYSGRTVTLVIRYEDFETHSHQKTYRYFFDEGLDIFKAAKSTLRKVVDRHRMVRLLGVSVSNLSRGEKQENLFSCTRSESLMKALDEINDRYGEFSVTRGSILYTESKQNIVPFGMHKQKGTRR
jgi:DNA polymerase-4